MESKSSRQALLSVVILSSFVTPFLGSSINIALPSIGNQFGMDAVSMGWLSTAYLLAASVFLVPFGRIADIYGRKRIYLYGIVVITVSSLLCGLANSEAVLIIFRVLQGLGGSMIFGTGIAMLTSAYPPEDRGRILGINVASTYIGLSIGPVIGGFLTQNFTWRSIFFVSVAFGIYIIIAVFLKLKDGVEETQKESVKPFDTIFYALALFCLLYGFLRLPQILGVVLIISGIVGFVVFGMLQLKSDSPILDVSIFRGNRVFVFSSLAALINFSATFAVTFLISLYLQYLKGFDPKTAGFIMMIQPVMQALLSPFAGKLSDKTDAHKIASLGMLFSVVGLFMLIFMTASTNIIYIMAGLALLGIGAALFSSPNTSSIMGAVHRKFYGVASGVVGTMRIMGQVFSMGTATLVFTLYMGAVVVTPEYYGKFVSSCKIIFVILTILSVAGVFASLAKKNKELEGDGI